MKPPAEAIKKRKFYACFMLTGEAQPVFVELGKNPIYRNTIGKEKNYTSPKLLYMTRYLFWNHLPTCHVILLLFDLMNWCNILHLWKKETNISVLSQIYSFIDNITSPILFPATLKYFLYLVHHQHSIYRVHYNCILMCFISPCGRLQHFFCLPKLLNHLK